MDRLNQLRTFIRVAERASFSAVARDLGVTQSAVSRALGALEKDLGIRLVSRSTRSVALTDAGQVYYQRCRQILDDLDDADAALGDLNRGLSGTLHIAAPAPFGLMFISPLAIRFRQMHPELTINLSLNDQPANLVEQNIDVAIRLGHLQTLGIIARKLGSSPVVTVAAPAYLSSHGRPEQPQQLASHQCLLYTNQINPDDWSFATATGETTVSVTGGYRCNNLLALKDAARAGLGIARLPLWMVEDEIAAGTLLRLLQETSSPAYAMHAVFPSLRQIPLKVSRFVDFLQEELGNSGRFR